MPAPLPLVNRRDVLRLGGGIAAGGLLAGALPSAASAHDRRHGNNGRGHGGDGREARGTLPSDQIQQIVQAEGTVTNGVLTIDISRDDIGDVAGPLGVTFDGSFEVDGTLTFQPIGRGQAFFNGDIPVKPEEANPFIAAIIANGLIFQAFHQHFIEMNPNVWFIHFRGEGDPLALARAVRKVLAATSTSLPQTMPSNPTTPLDPNRLGSILHGDAQVGDEGVVTVTVDRTDTIVIDGIRVSPEANISTMIEFKPISGSTAWVAPDFSMTSPEVMPVINRMQQQGWFVGCLYNQETNEYPQLYFSHMLKKGDAYALAAEVRNGLNLTRSD